MAFKAAQADTTKFLDCISCHAFNADRSQVVLSLKNNAIEIYKTNGETDARKWDKTHTIIEECYKKKNITNFLIFHS